MRAGLLFTTTFVLVAIANAACPNKCSGHGSCGSSDVCACQPTWLGGDCSDRECPYVRAWVDTAQFNSDAHYFAECGNRGSCDRTTGQCVCDAGFTGKGCRRMSCPNDCSAHGTCEFIEELAADTDKRVGGSAGVTYTSWDQEKIVGCKCDAGYEGHNCAQRVCPKGDDPLTTSQSDMQQLIATTENSGFFLTYYDPYGESWTTGKISGVGAFGTSSDQNTVCERIQQALRRLPNHALDKVTVTHNPASNKKFTRTAGADVSTSGAGTSTDITELPASNWICQVNFPAAAGTSGLQHLLGCNVEDRSAAGYQPVSGSAAATVCNVYELAGTADISTLKLTELETCSKRGKCDSATGACECFPGHKGAACEKQEALV